MNIYKYFKIVPLFSSLILLAYVCQLIRIKVLLLTATLNVYILFIFP